MLKEITTTLGISQGTLNTHLRALYRKFNVNSRSEIMIRCFAGTFGREDMALRMSKTHSGGERRPGKSRLASDRPLSP